jgi:hypothetical protein
MRYLGRGLNCRSLPALLGTLLVLISCPISNPVTVDSAKSKVLSAVVALPPESAQPLFPASQGKESYPSRPANAPS